MSISPEQVFDLEDLIPEEAEFTLHRFPEKKLVLSAFSLKYQIWAKKRFGDNIKEIFEKEKVTEICEIAFQLLKGAPDFDSPPGDEILTKEAFKNFDHFTDSIRSTKDKIGLIKALLKTIGFSQPILEKAAEKVQEAEEKIKKKMAQAETTPPLEP